MNILQVCANYPPVPGGHGIYAQNLSAELLKYGVNTVVATFKPKNYSSSSIDKFPVKRVNAFFLNSIEYPIYSPMFLSDIHKIVETYEIDVINCHTRFFTSTFLSALYKKMSGKVLLVHTEHGAGPLVHDNKYVTSISNIYDSIFGKWAIKAADIPIAIGPSSMNFMKKLGCKKDIQIIPNSINCRDLEKLYIRNNLNNRDKLIISYIGRLVESKGISDLIMAFSQIEPYYDVELWIVGSGPDEFKFKELVKSLNIKNVYFWGFRSDIGTILSKTNIFVNPSHYDSVPTTILEAGCLGVRVVASNVGDVQYILGNDYPYLYNTGSFNELKRKIVDIIEASNFKANDIRKRVYKHFNWEQNSKKYFEMISYYIKE